MDMGEHRNKKEVSNENLNPSLADSKDPGKLRSSINDLVLPETTPRVSQSHATLFNGRASQELMHPHRQNGLPHLGRPRS